MTGHDELLQAVLANPDDDSPRLLYADWQDEFGDAARAEFIRVQIERYRRYGDRQPLDDREFVGLIAREKALFGKHFRSWLKPLQARGEPFQSRDSHAIYRRGFIHEVWMRAKTFITRGHKLFARVPCRGLKLIHATSDDFCQLITMPLIARLHTLDLNSIVWNARMADEFLGSRFLRSISRIELVAADWVSELKPAEWPSTTFVILQPFL